MVQRNMYQRITFTMRLINRIHYLRWDTIRKKITSGINILQILLMQKRLETKCMRWKTFMMDAPMHLYMTAHLLQKNQRQQLQQLQNQRQRLQQLQNSQQRSNIQLQEHYQTAESKLQRAIMISGSSFLRKSQSIIWKISIQADNYLCLVQEIMFLTLINQRIVLQRARCLILQ